jgi:hypothetical protein
VNPRLARPALAILVGGALIAGGAISGSPAYANPDAASTDAASTDAVANPSNDPPSAEDPAEPPVVTDPATPPVVADPATPPVVTNPTTPPVVTDPGTPPVVTDPPVVPEPPVVTPPAADTTKPTGSFRLNHTSVWTGQQITVGQAAGEFSDPVDAPGTLKRVISWGDGTYSELSPSTAAATKAYGRTGNFAVTVTITDPAGNQSSIPSRTVAVTAPAAKVSLSKKSAYQGTTFQVKVAKVPAGATGMRIDWSDGWVSTHKARKGSFNGSVLYQWRWDGATKKYVRVGNGRLSGARVVRVSWGNAKGYAAPQTAGWIKIVKDGWRPTVSIKKPSAPNRAASWKTISGTAADKGSGLRHVGVTVVRLTSAGKLYCLKSNKKWQRVYDDAGIVKHCYTTGVKVKVVKGKWSLKLPTGIAKNQFIAVEAWAYDRADNFRSTYRTARLTRS